MSLAQGQIMQWAVLGLQAIVDSTASIIFLTVNCLVHFKPPIRRANNNFP